MSPASAHNSKLLGAYPWTQAPLVVSAPMASVASPKLVAEVTKAHGLGFIGGGYDTDAVEQKLLEAQQLLDGAVPASTVKDGIAVPVGLGLLVFAVELDKFTPVLKKLPPAAMWLFGAPSIADYQTWTLAIRKACRADIWIQTGSVTEALQIAQACNPDVLVMQGTDAGGHGPDRGASLISLLPEASDALTKAGYGHIPLVAAGGIADGRGVAAAIALGAAAAVMGTRFLAATEAGITNRAYVDAVLAASDGGRNTVRSKVFDEMGPNGNIWPSEYDGRAVRNLTHADHEKGVAIAENRKLFQTATKEAGAGFEQSMEQTRATAWAGTAVGLVNEVQDSAKIVQQSRQEARQILHQAQALI